MGYPHYTNDCFEHWNCVTICGSMRFYERMLIVAERLTREGFIVLMPFSVVAESDQGGELKTKLDELHKRKIELSKRIVVVSDESGYFGDSTKSEIEFANRRGLAVSYVQVALKPPAYK